MLRRFSRSLLRLIFRVLFLLLTRLEIEGLENIPAEGAVLMTANHLSVVDAALVFMSLNRPDGIGFVAKKYQKNLLYSLFVEIIGGIWLNREEADSQAIRKARNHLQEGGYFGIAPEGTRSSTGALIPGKIGAAYLAEIAKVPVQPVAIYGTERAGYRIPKFENPKIHVVFGKLYTLPPIDRKDRDAGLQRNTDEIMCRIATMLPPEYRGVYTDHPRLQELLEKN